ncbi:hypothetical protein Thal_0324 [Thermocrinis albus DSM 14484]|uniref:Uncharacterized protein n=1 Tax=Thermocrinis albus (strain DSM 14484 / JCM 11386 / HI 11/12) TaxID=638303 RepID=D3SP72_THEAH|nr:hypothetical protein [Thermocrinis albus]ADC88959.1 hypothetical protein Thal_0324 [Thermocrinis albus DSM 14484]
MTEKEKFEKLLQKAQLVDPNITINFVMLDLSPRWMKCRRTRRLVFQFHKLGDQEGVTQCGKSLQQYQILPERQENLVITQVNMMLGGLGLQVFFDLCPQCFGNVNRCNPEE